MCYWATVEFSECNNTSQHSYQLGLMCANAHRNRDWCDEDEWVELDTTTPSKLPDVQYPCARCKGLRVRFVDFP